MEIKTLHNSVSNNYCGWNDTDRAGFMRNIQTWPLQQNPDTRQIMQIEFVNKHPKWTACMALTISAGKNYKYKHHCGWFDCFWIVTNIRPAPYGRRHVVSSAVSLAGVTRRRRSRLSPASKRCRLPRTGIKPAFCRYQQGKLVLKNARWSNLTQSCPRVTFLGPDPTRRNVDPTRPDPRLPTKSLTRPDPRPDPSPYVKFLME